MSKGEKPQVRPAQGVDRMVRSPAEQKPATTPKTQGGGRQVQEPPAARKR